jgi:hypothetical protein
MHWRIVRDSATGNPNFGKLTFDEVPDLILDDIELPWVPDPAGGPGGHPDTSCVPVGVYQLVKHSSAKHPQTWALVNPALNVYHFEEDGPPGCRFVCLVHPDNVAATLLGCIGPGLSRGTLNGAPAVLSSGTAFARIQAAVPWTDDHTLEITAA